MEVCCFDFIKYFLWVASLEWKISWYKGVKKDTERPNISLSLIASMEHFRCHVVWCSCHISQILCLASSWKTEIDESYGSWICNHDILRFDISVNDSLSMTMVDCLEQFLHITCSLLLTEGLILLLGNLIKELLSTDKLHYQVNVLVVVISLKVFNDIWVV